MGVIWVTTTIIIVFVFESIYAFPPEDYFEKGKFVTNSEGWEYRYNGTIYHLGMMVSPQSLVVTLVIVFGLIGTVVYTGIKKI